MFPFFLSFFFLPQSFHFGPFTHGGYKPFRKTSDAVKRANAYTRERTTLKACRWGRVTWC